MGPLEADVQEGVAMVQRCGEGHGAARGRGGVRVQSWLMGGAAVGALVAIAACAGPKQSSRDAMQQPTAAAAGEVAGETRSWLAQTSGFQSPESIIYDSTDDCYFVSNLNGPIGVTPGKGFISRLTPAGTIDSLHFIVGGKDGVTLNAPMGTRIHHDTLWVVDVDVLRAFDPKTGHPLRTVSLASLHPHILNDFDWGPDGAIYVTDMGMLPNPKGMPRPGAPMRILRVVPGAAPTVALESQRLDTPDGIAWDGSGHRFIITPFGTNADSVETWTIGASAPRGIAHGKGMFDGVEYEHNGAIYVTSWAAQEAYQLEGDSLVTVARGFKAPSDVTLDTRRNQLGITDFKADAVAVVALPGGGAVASAAAGK